MNVARIGSVIIVLLGVAVLFFGTMLYMNAQSGTEALANSQKKMGITDIDKSIATLTTNLTAIATAEEPQIQTGKAAPSSMYAYLLAQTSNLSLMKSSAGLLQLTSTIGLISILAGIGIILAGIGIFLAFAALPKVAEGIMNAIGPMLSGAK